jgi:branched-chain amino acid transport system permease protein
MGGPAYFLQQGLNALSLAAFYMPLSLAFSLLQAVSGRIFLSFGDVAMFGSFAAVYICFGLLLHGFEDWQAAGLALLAALVCSASLGVVAARQIFERLRAASGLSFMIGSIGFSLILQEGMRLASNSGDVWVPPLFDGLGLSLVGGNYPVRVTVNALYGMTLSSACVLAVFGVLRLTSFGRNWRATTDNPRLAMLCGIDVTQVFIATFALGSALAAVSGWMASVSYGGTNSSAGLMLGFKAMFASLAGGFGSPRGAILGAFGLAILEVGFSVLVGGAWRDVGVFVVIVSILLLRSETELRIDGDRP